jgi:phospholipase C
LASPATQQFQRVLIIVLENQGFDALMSNDYLKQLAGRGTLLTNFHAVDHPSYPNYLAMIAGRRVPTFGDAQQTVDLCHVGDLLASRGLDWKNYAEDYPGASGKCYLESGQGKYARKHVPYLSFQSVQTSSESCSHIASAAQFDLDRVHGTLPAYMFYSPNLDNDGHNTDLETAAKWLKGFLDHLLADPHFMDGTLVIVTFDEAAPDLDRSNQIVTLLVGPMVGHGSDNANYDHFSVLKSIEQNFGLCALGTGDQAATPVNSIGRR